MRKCAVVWMKHPRQQKIWRRIQSVLPTNVSNVFVSAEMRFVTGRHDTGRSSFSCSEAIRYGGESKKTLFYKPWPLNMAPRSLRKANLVANIDFCEMTCTWATTVQPTILSRHTLRLFIRMGSKGQNFTILPCSRFR
jgi:hypothetical protein